MKRARVLLGEDHLKMGEALGRILMGEFELVGIARDGLALIDAVAKLAPDIIVTDIYMPVLDGLEALAQLKAANPNIKVILITNHEDPTLARFALEDAGACGFVLKRCANEDLIQAVRAVLHGNTYISASLAAQIVSNSSSISEASLSRGLGTHLTLDAPGDPKKHS